MAPVKKIILLFFAFCRFHDAFDEKTHNLFKIVLFRICLFRPHLVRRCLFRLCLFRLSFRIMSFQTMFFQTAPCDKHPFFSHVSLTLEAFSSTDGHLLAGCCNGRCKLGDILCLVLFNRCAEFTSIAQHMTFRPFFWGGKIRTQNTHRTNTWKIMKEK